MRRIDKLHRDHPFMGTRMLRRELQKKGFQAKRRHISTLMRLLNIEPLVPKSGTSKARLGHQIYHYPLRHRPLTGANQVWALNYHLHSNAARIRLTHCRD